MAFAAVVAAQVGCVFACRDDSASFMTQSPFSNKLIWWGVASELLFLLGLLYVPFLQAIFHTTAVPFSPNVVSLAVLPLGMLLWSDIHIHLSHLLQRRAYSRAR
jgi:Ca2+-transporting ATPase